MDRQASTLAERTVEAAWHEHRGYLVALANRLLSDRAGAEDAVQEAYSHLARVDPSEIEDVRAWLTVVVRRRSLDRLRSAYQRRETTVGTPRDDAGAPAPQDPLDRVTLDDEVQLALSVVLDRLTPAERTSFVLHDVFGFPFPAVARIVGRSPQACRQLASRARRTVRSAPPPSGADAAVLHELADRFVAACAGGDLDALMAVLDPDVVGESTTTSGHDLGGARGRRLVARALVRFLGPDSGATLVPVALERGLRVIVSVPDRYTAVVRLGVCGGRITDLHTYVRFDDGWTPPSAQ